VKYRGVVVPMVSPFTPSGAIDEPAVRRIVDHLIAGGVGGVFPLGTTGESASMHRDDKQRLIELTVTHARGRAMVYAGVSGNSLRESVEAARVYAELGADALVAHPPSYYPLTDAEIEGYFLRLADAVPRPLVLYNIPATTHHSIPLDALDRLRAHGNVVAVKDSSGDRARLTALLARTGGRDGFPVLLGSSPVYAHGLRAGAVGLVPSGAHLIPQTYQSMYEAAIRGDFDRVDQLQREADEVCSRYLKGRSIGQGLAALKTIMAERGLCGPTMLPPLQDHVGAV
jgi:dihydrodipicolinate synthase/N-acetylneuraminate lyase